ncbi:LPS assembly lipoprotein LptE [Pseudooceanicola antarcticus]|uniref:LPS assembly lipoprotein LptE n=1 Tax=Pseudooceanicola antarcticus TaxID=1247613 RepID=UPI001E6497A3|nr:LPS assembly lipoprotein LptE [Pseudooceanicola antarcticus]
MKLLAGLGLAGVSACGFSPVYAPGGPASRLYGRTALPEPNTEESYQLVRALEGRLGRATAPDYALDLTLRLSESRLAVTAENSTTRFRVAGRLDYALRDARGNELTRGEVTSFTGYSATGSTVATQAAKSDARARVVVILSDLLMTRLVAELPPVPTAET